MLKGTVDLEREEGEECEENMEIFDDSSSSPSGTLRNYPLTCKVLYSYKVLIDSHGVAVCGYMLVHISNDNHSTRYTIPCVSAPNTPSKVKCQCCIYRTLR